MAREEGATALLEEELQTVVEPVKPKRVMVLGANGMLGSDVASEFRQLGWDVLAPLRDEVDSTKAEAL
ncbi:MAG: sugar nucleotide-binding protein, partial [Proteobacteria bacterium]|nr:sugar nucleotide-binding protein [Pseudomonadota bacterium]